MIQILCFKVALILIKGQLYLERFFPFLTLTLEISAKRSVVFLLKQLAYWGALPLSYLGCNWGPHSQWLLCPSFEPKTQSAVWNTRLSWPSKPISDFPDEIQGTGLTFTLCMVCRMYLFKNTSPNFCIFELFKLEKGKHLFVAL